MEIKIGADKTYKTRQNALKAVDKVKGANDYRFFINTTEDGRFHPVFIGEKAITAGLHFHFSVIG